jgi:glucan 1,3-beta-glucosidase
VRVVNRSLFSLEHGSNILLTDGGNQQYTVRNFEFSSQTTASICLIWDWGWTWSQLVIANSPIGILLLNPKDTTGQQAGSIYVLDTVFENVRTAIFAYQLPSTVLKSSVITLDNIGVVNVGTMIGFVDGTSLDVAPADLEFLVVGNIENDGSMFGMYYANVPVPDPSMLDSSSPPYARQLYFGKSRPQYEGLTASQVINVKAHGVKGDGTTDDTAAIAAVLAMATVDNLIYFPAGSYIVTSKSMFQCYTVYPSLVLLNKWKEGVLASQMNQNN